MRQYSIFRDQLPVQASSLPGTDDITRAVLPNGITLLARANFNSPSVVISGYLTSGGMFDPDEKLGLADFVSVAMMRGTAQRDFQTLYDALESIGASLSFNGATHTTSFSGKTLAEDLPLLMEILAETLREPVFPAKQIARLRAQLLTGLAIRAQDTQAMASLTFDQIVYKGHPYSRPEDGYLETVQAITREDLVDFHKQHYGPKGMVIAVVGAVDPQQVLVRLTQVLGDWENPGQPDPLELPPVTPLEDAITQKVEIPGKSQSDIVMGVAGPPRSAPDYIPAALGNNILGQFGMMGRVGGAVRERAGLAYYASSSVSGGMGPGPWSVSAGVDPANVDPAVALIRSEIERFVNEPVEAEELSDSKANYIGRLPLALESNAGVAGALLNLERYNLGLDYYQRYADLINAVTLEDVLAAAKNYLHPDKLAISIAGP
jgi:zinc protease